MAGVGVTFALPSSNPHYPRLNGTGTASGWTPLRTILLLNKTKAKVFLMLTPEDWRCLVIVAE